MLNTRGCVLLGLVALSLQITCSHAFLEAGSCAGRCDSRNDNRQPCQCNSHCEQYNDCCADYKSRCGEAPSSCGTVSQVAQKLWNSDVNRLSPRDYTVNFQTQVSDGTTSDRASSRLFTYVNQAKLSGPTYSAFLSLLNNYNPNEAYTEQSSSRENREVNTFLDAVLNTRVMNELLTYFRCTGKARSKANLKALLRTMWFDFYARGSRSARSSTSGFEHFIGEYKTGAALVNGFHSWLSFYTKEKSGALNYLGYVSKKTPNLIGAVFNWNSHVKTKGTMFVGVSPEFDLAIYTLCAVTHKNDKCSFKLAGRSQAIVSYDKSGHITTAFVL